MLASQGADDPQAAAGSAAAACSNTSSLRVVARAGMSRFRWGQGRTGAGTLAVSSKVSAWRQHWRVHADEIMRQRQINFHAAPFNERVDTDIEPAGKREVLR